MKSHRDQSADIAQTHLPRDLARGDEVGLVHRALQIDVPHEFARVDVDDRHRLRLVDDEVPAVFQRNGALRQLVKLLGDAVFAQHLPLALVERDLALAHVCPHPRELHHPLVGRLVAHIDARDAAAETVAHDLEGKIEFAVHHVADGRRPGRLLPPNSTPVSDIPIQS